MAPLCSQNDPQRAPQLNNRERKENIESNLTERSALLKQQSKKEHRLSKPRTKDRARHAACASAEVVLHGYTQIIALES